MATSDRRTSRFPAVLALGTLILLLLLLGYYFENCLKKQISLNSNVQNVLGVSTFGSSPSKNPVVNGETFNFTATIVGDQAGVLNATALFDLTGQGVINSNIQGTGTCLKLTDTTAVCNNVDIDPNQTITWTIPVTTNSNCSQQSPPSLTLQTRLVATLVTSTSTATAGCVSSQQSATNPPTNATTAPGSTNAPTGNQNGTSNTSNTSRTTTGGNAPATSGSFDFAGLACSKVSGLPLVFILLILWLLATAYYFIFRRRN